MKVLVLSGGTGTRLRPLTYSGTKQLIPVANRPVLFYIMDLVQLVGIESTGMIVSSQWGEQVKGVIGDGTHWGTVVTYITQHKPRGLADAVKRAATYLGKSPFIMILGDNVYSFNIVDFINEFVKEKVDALLLLKEVANPYNYGTAVLDNKGMVLTVEEKSPSPGSNLALAGIYILSPSIHEAIIHTKPSQRGELEITDAIQKLIESGGIVKGHMLDGWWIDIGSRKDLLKANQATLRKFLKPSLDGKLDLNSRIEGAVEIRHETIIKNSLIKGPVSIAENCTIIDSIVGPFASIGESAVIDSTSIENSIVMPNCHIKGLNKLKDSILGMRTVCSSRRRDAEASLFVGDDNELML